MRAVVYDQFGARPSVQDVRDPIVPANGVVLAVGATGVCRSDWHAWAGDFPDVVLPHVPGHEFAGTVVEVGAHVQRWQVGDRVTAPFVQGCGACRQCAAGHQNICDNGVYPGFSGWGSFAEFVAVEHADGNLVRLPDTMDFDAAASLGCRFVTAFRAIVDRGQVLPGEWVAVHGCGGLGLSAVMIARAMGAQVIAVDTSDDKLDLARSLGATVGINVQHTDASAAIRDATGGGAHVSLDALGHADVCVNSIRSLRKLGRHVQVGLLGAGNVAPVPMDEIVDNELQILGSQGMQAYRYDAMLAMVESGAVAPYNLIGRRLTLSESVDVLVAMESSQQAGVAVVTNLS